MKTTEVANLLASALLGTKVDVTDRGYNNVLHQCEAFLDVVTYVNKTDVMTAAIDGQNFSELKVIEPFDKFFLPRIVSVDGSLKKRNFKDAAAQEQIMSSDLITGKSFPELCAKLPQFFLLAAKLLPNLRNSKERSIEDARHEYSFNDDRVARRYSLNGYVEPVTGSEFWLGVPVALTITPYEDDFYTLTKAELALQKFIACIPNYGKVQQNK